MSMLNKRYQVKILDQWVEGRIVENPQRMQGQATLRLMDGNKILMITANKAAFRPVEMIMGPRSIKEICAGIFLCRPQEIYWASDQTAEDIGRAIKTAIEELLDGNKRDRLSGQALRFAIFRIGSAVANEDMWIARAYRRLRYKLRGRLFILQSENLLTVDKEHDFSYEEEIRCISSALEEIA